MGAEKPVMTIQFTVSDWVLAAFAIWGAIALCAVALYFFTNLLARRIPEMERAVADELTTDAAGWDARSAAKAALRGQREKTITG